MISLDKKNLPKYLYKLNIALICFFAVWFGLGVPLMLTIGCIFDESVITYAVMIATFAAFFIGLAVFCVIDFKLQKRLIKERTAELEKEFVEMPFDESERILKERGVITDTGFVVYKGVDIFDNLVVPFEKAWLGFNFGQFASRIKISIDLFSEEGYEPKAVYNFDCAMYNFILGKDMGIKDNFYFKLFVKDKGAFAKFVLTPIKLFTFKYR